MIINKQHMGRYKFHISKKSVTTEDKDIKARPNLIRRKSGLRLKVLGPIPHNKAKALSLLDKDQITLYSTDQEISMIEKKEKAGLVNLDCKGILYKAGLTVSKFDLDDTSNILNYFNVNLRHVGNRRQRLGLELLYKHFVNIIIYLDIFKKSVDSCLANLRNLNNFDNF
jgi:hypothetical protein